MVQIPIGCDIKILLDCNELHTKEYYSNVIKEFKECGFRYFNFHFGEMLRSEDSVRWAHTIREALEETGAKCSLVHEPIPAMFEQTDEKRELCRRTLQLCSILGIDWIATHPIPTNGNFNRDQIEQIKERHREYFEEYVPELEKWNVGVAVENLSNIFSLNYDGTKRMFGDNPYDLIEIVDRVGSDKVQLCLDIGHLHTMGLFDIGDVVRDMGPRLKALHVHDNNAMADQHYFPYMGSIDWKAFVDALREIGYEGVFMYEADKIPSKYPTALKKPCLKFMGEIAEYIVSL